MDALQQRQVRIGNCIDKVVAEFHTPLLRELARLGVGLREARRFFPAAGEREDGYARFLAAYTAYRQATEAHVFKEEVEIYPRLRVGAAAPAASLYVMRLEHEAEERTLDQLVASARACTPQEGAEEAWAQLLVEVEALATFQRQHAGYEETTLLPLALGE